MRNVHRAGSVQTVVVEEGLVITGIKRPRIGDHENRGLFFSPGFILIHGQVLYVGGLTFKPNFFSH